MTYKSLIGAILALFFALSAVYADPDTNRKMTIKLVYEGKVPESRRGGEVIEARYDTTVIWITDSLTRSESGSTVVLYDVAADQLIFLHAKFEIYQVVDRAGRWRTSAVDDSLTRDMIMGMMQASDKIEFSCAPTDDRDTILGMPSTKYVVTKNDFQLSLTNESWTWYSDLAFVPKQAFYGAYYDLDYFLGRQSLDRCMKEIPGIPLIRRPSSGFGYERRLVSISVEAVDSSFFSIPVGYEEFR